MQLSIENKQFTNGILPDGTQISPGDLVQYSHPTCGGMVGFTRVVLLNGDLCMEENHLMGKGTSIAHWLKQASYYEIKKVSLADIYSFCKANNWDTAKYVTKFSKISD